MTAAKSGWCLESPTLVTIRRRNVSDRIRGSLIVILLLLIAACGGGSPLAVDAGHFAGLDRAVVEEVLANPVAVNKIEEEPSSIQASAAQGIVINFITCREAFKSYEGWVNTGVAPQLDGFPEPLTPTEPSYSANKFQYSQFESAIDSGELDQLRFTLTAEGSCGQWIPAAPGDEAGPTIRDIVESGL